MAYLAFNLERKDTPYSKAQTHFKGNSANFSDAYCLPASIRQLCTAAVDNHADDERNTAVLEEEAEPGSRRNEGRGR